jgi:hypothetical protein
MKKSLLFIFLAAAATTSAQTLVQSVNSGSLITASSSVSIGEIVVVPANPDQTGSGLIAILAQSQQTLEVPELELAQHLVVYPNPTTSEIFFRTEENLSGMDVSVFNNAGQLVLKQTVSGDNSLHLETLSQGIYLIRFSDKKINAFKIIKH